MKKKRIIVGSIIVVVVLILSFVITYLVAYKNNDSEVVKFMNNVKLNLDGQYDFPDL